jgi:pseudoazurin
MRYFLILIITLWTGLSYAAGVEVEMLNKLNNEFMVYSKKIVKIDVGDTVFWKSTTPGHNVEFIKGGVPEGVGKFKSKLSKDTEYKFTVPGIYAYWCTPHKSMGMIGFVIVGNDLSNMESIIKVKYSGKAKKIAKELIGQI